MIHGSITAGVAAPSHHQSFAFDEDADGLILAQSQDIPESWADWLAAKRRESWENRKNTEYLHVASIPSIFVTKWLREGFDIWTAPNKEIVKKLHLEDLTGFLATEKRAV